MLFCIDVGNTNIVFGLTDKNRILHHWRIRTDPKITPDELGVIVDSLLHSARRGPDDIKNVIVTSVVPPLLRIITEFSSRYLNIKPIFVDHTTDTGMPIKYANPREVGSDRIVNSVGAYEKYHTALVVVDLGTATTFDYISGDGCYMGGAIAPGILISCEALYQKSSRLPRLDTLTRPKNAIAKDTVSSMNAGIIYGYAGLVDGIVNRIKKESGETLTVIATGGLAPLIYDISETIDHIEEYLTIEGLMAIFNKQDISA